MQVEPSVLSLSKTCGCQGGIMRDLIQIRWCVWMVFEFFRCLTFEVEVSPFSMAHEEVKCEFSTEGVQLAECLCFVVLFVFADFLFKSNHSFIEDSLDNPLLKGLVLNLLHLFS